MEKIQIKERMCNGISRVVENDDCAVVQGVLGKRNVIYLFTSRVGVLETGSK